VDDEGGLAPVKVRSWTRIEDYFESLARRRAARRSREFKLRTEPESPRFVLSTLPFIALFIGLAVLAIGIAIAAWPGGQPAPKPQAERHEPGFAPKGWFQEAQKEMRRRS